MTSNEPSFRKGIEDYIRARARPPDKFSHQQRLHQLAGQLAEDKPYDDDILHAAAWLHDLGVFIGHRPEDPLALAAWDHIAYVTHEAPRLMRDFGFPATKILAVIEAIRTHLPSGNPTALEGVLLRDADILEQLGAVAILRTVSKVGRDTRFIVFSDALRVLRRNAEELPKQLKLDAARRLAEPRLKALHDFLDAADSEQAGSQFEKV